MSWLPPRGVHNITLGSSIRRSLASPRANAVQAAQSSRNEFVAMRYNVKPPGVVNATGSLAPAATYAHKDSFQMELSSETGEQHSFSARSETKKELDCVLFYDASTGTLVLERLDSLLVLTHQRAASATGPPTTLTTASGLKGAPNGLLPNRAHPTAFPPTPPSTSPPEYASLPETGRTKERARPVSSAGTPRAIPLDPPSPAHVRESSGADNEPAPLAAPATGQTATIASRKVPQSMSEYAQEQRRLQEARQRSSSGFASDPNEENLTFGKPAGASAPPSSGNALRLSDMPLRRGDKRKFSDSEPDEEELEFGRPSKEIKRAKTASQSPASVTYGTPPAQVSYSDSAPSPARAAHLHPVSLRSSAAAAHSTNMVHGSSPLVKSHALVEESDSDDEEDETSDSDSEPEAPAPTFAPASHNEMELVSVDPDGEEDDFLMAAFDNDDNAGGGADNGSDDSSDESDYDER